MKKNELPNLYSRNIRKVTIFQENILTKRNDITNIFFFYFIAVIINKVKIAYFSTPISYLYQSDLGSSEFDSIKKLLLLNYFRNGKKKHAEF